MLIHPQTYEARNQRNRDTKMVSDSLVWSHPLRAVWMLAILLLLVLAVLVSVVL